MPHSMQDNPILDRESITPAVRLDTLHFAAHLGACKQGKKSLCDSRRFIISKHWTITSKSGVANKRVVGNLPALTAATAMLQAPSLKFDDKALFWEFDQNIPRSVVRDL